jgi:hypothetical protein
MAIRRHTLAMGHDLEAYWLGEQLAHLRCSRPMNPKYRDVLYLEELVGPEIDFLASNNSPTSAVSLLCDVQGGS